MQLLQKFPSEIKFAYPWRSYQAMLLEELDAHLDDNHLNVVAAPGSGKTVVGLEVMLRINKPTLILSPTRAIRNQWVQRFLDLFLQQKDAPDWLSQDIRNPGLLTVVTYQGLYSAFAGTDDPELDDDPEEIDEDLYPIRFKDANEIIEKLKSCGLKTLMVDEAHHLRNAWWESLTLLKQSMEKIKVVALTATPPYDVASHEWENYHNLCGPIDVEISVPELVLDKNLCPHQDYVFFNELSESEKATLQEFHNDLARFMNDLSVNQDFLNALMQHPFVTNPEVNLENILEKPDAFSSILIFLNAQNQDLPPKLFGPLGVTQKKIPRFNLEWSEILLEHLLYYDSYFKETHSDLHKTLLRTLKQIGCVEKRKIFLQKNSTIKRLLQESTCKLESILEITRLEKANLKDDLRMVILSDFIREEFLPRNKSETLAELTRIGVCSIFEKIRRDFPELKKLGILCGTLVVLPETAIPLLKKLIEERGFQFKEMNLLKLGGDDQFFVLTTNREVDQSIVELVTAIFTQGEIEVLVGTKSLLGEGWDAPAINTLILASFVGSFMLSNQMRGRAIRIDPNHPAQVANIWHLVSIQTVSAWNRLESQMPSMIEPRTDAELGGFDLERLERRFKAFVGLHYDGSSIESGYDRLQLLPGPYTHVELSKMNQSMKEKAVLREEMTANWNTVLANGELKKLIPQLQAPEEELPQKFIFMNTFELLLKNILFMGLFIFALLFRSSFDRQGHSNFPLEKWWLIFMIPLLYLVPALLRALYLFIKHVSLEGSMKQLGTALLKTLCYLNLIQTDVNKLQIICKKRSDGRIVSSLEGASYYESNLFLDSLEEILMPIKNPRYLISFSHRWKIFNRNAYFPVPTVIGAKREYVNYFSKMWNKYLTPNTPVYTRSIEGRKILLKARELSLGRRFQNEPSRISTWK